MPVVEVIPNSYPVMEAPGYLRFRLFVLSLSVAFSTFVAISIQVPAFSTLDIARTSFKNTSNSFGVNEIRFGVWSACLQRSSNAVDACDGFSPCTPSEQMRICSPIQYGYRFQVGPTNATSESFVLKPAWTRAFPLLVANAIMTSIVLALLILHWPSGFICSCAVFIGVLSILTQVAFYYHMKFGMKRFNGSIGVNASSGPGFGLSLVAFFLLAVDGSLNWIDSEDRKKRRTPRQPPRVYDLRVPSPPSFMATRTAFTGNVTLGGGRASSRTTTVPLPRTPDAAHTRLPRKPSIRSVYVEDDYECPICMEGGAGSGENLDLEAQARSSKTGIEYSSLPCKHIFCTRCITRALGLATRCPLCNAHSTVADLRPAPHKPKARHSWFHLPKSFEAIKSKS